MDRIVDGLAVLVPVRQPGTRIQLDRSLLPPGARDGTILRVRIEIDPQASSAGRQEIARLQAELEKGD